MIVLLLALALAGYPATAAADTAAQDRPGIRFIELSRTGGMVLRVHDVLAEPALEEALRSGLPLRIRIRIELWRDRFFDQLTASSLWHVTLVYDPVTQEFIARHDAVGVVRSRNFAVVRSFVERDHAVDLAPTRTGGFYFTGILEIESLSLSDLEELERWLQGELQPAVAGERPIGGAVGHGMKRLLIRVLRLPTRRYEARSTRFIVER